MLILAVRGLLSGCVPVAAAKSLWSSAPATYGSSDDESYILKTGFLLGNGKLGGMDAIVYRLLETALTSNLQPYHLDHLGQKLLCLIWTLYGLEVLLKSR